MSLLLIVEDEPDLRELVEHTADAHGYEYAGCATGREALTLARRLRPALVILDLMLPDLSGIEVCQRLRADPVLAATPVLMLTARTAESDRIQGLEAGADDYLSKPFSIRELMLRVKAILRRAPATGLEAPAVTTLRCNGIALDDIQHTVTIDHVPLYLTALEFRLLRTLLLRQGEVQSRQTLLEDVWGMSPDLQTRTVDTHVKRLRERLGAQGEAIHTVRGFGYCLRQNGLAEPSRD